MRRDYTPRHFDPVANTLTIKFALHVTGPVADWATQACVGQTVMIGGPGGSFNIPTDFDWQLLVGDESALPAIGRRHEELPAGARVIAEVQVADPADQRVLTSATDLSLRWVVDDAGLRAAVRALAWPVGEGYVWCAGQARSMTTLRRSVVEKRGHSPQAIRAAAYWKRGGIAHHENIEA